MSELIEASQLVVLVVWFLFWYSDHERERRKCAQDDWEKKQA